MRIWRVDLLPRYPAECRLAAVEVEAETEMEAARIAARHLTYLDDYPQVLNDGAGVGEYDAWGRGGRCNGSVVVTPAGAWRTVRRSPLAVAS